jgi:hypothetical protein
MEKLFSEKILSRDGVWHDPCGTHLRATVSAPILHGMLGFLRRLIAPDLLRLQDDVTALRATVSSLVSAEAERERDTTEVLDQLRRYWKRLRTRDGRETAGDPDDDLTQQVMRLKLSRGSQ